MTPECAAIIFHVSDLRNAVKFYTNILGFTIDFEFGSVIGLHYGNVIMHLSGPDNPGIRKAIGEGHMYIYCDEVNAYYEDITAKGAITVIPPGDRAYGMRDFAVKDQDGNIIAFGENIAAEK